MNITTLIYLLIILAVVILISQLIIYGMFHKKE